MALAQLLDASIAVWPADESFRYIRDFLACRNGIGDFRKGGPNPGPGYVIVDEFYQFGQDPLYEGDWVVFKSNGESGTYPHYIQLTFGNQSHNVDIFLHWDTTEHSGRGYGAFISDGYRFRNVAHSNFQGKMSIHADLDEIHFIMQGNQTANYWQCVGRLKPQNMLYDGTAVQVESASVAVENAEEQNIVLPAWPNWASVGTRVYHWDETHCVIVTIKAVAPAERRITVDRSYDMAAGSWMAGDLCLFVSSGQSPANLDISRMTVVNFPRRVEGLPTGSYGSASTYLYSSRIGMASDALYGSDFPNAGNNRVVNNFWLTHKDNSTKDYGIRGFFGLAGESSVQVSSGTVWQDLDGTSWRTYFITSGREFVALREVT